MHEKNKKIYLYIFGLGNGILFLFVFLEWRVGLALNI